MSFMTAVSWLLHVFLLLLDVVHVCCWCFFLMSFMTVAGVSFLMSFKTAVHGYCTCFYFFLMSFMTVAGVSS